MNTQKLLERIENYNLSNSSEIFYIGQPEDYKYFMDYVLKPLLCKAKTIGEVELIIKDLYDDDEFVYVSDMGELSSMNREDVIRELEEFNM